MLRLALYRPGRDAARVRCPLLVLVLVCEQDRSAYPPAATAQLDFLRRHLPGPARAGQAGPAAAADTR